MEITTTLVANVLAATLAAGAVSIAVAAAKRLSQWRTASEARQLADNRAFDDALASSDLEALGSMLRDRFGSVSLDAFLDDSVTQTRVFKSLERLTDMLNQPVPDPSSGNATTSSETADTAPEAATLGNELGAIDNEQSYVDALGQAQRLGLSEKIESIAEVAGLNIRVSGVWTGLAKARRDLEQAILPLLPDKQRALSPRIFYDHRLRIVMGRFLAVANRAIHGEDTSIEDADRAIRALKFIATELPLLPVEAPASK